jgi:hypothetical protein
MEQSRRLFFSMVLLALLHVVGCSHSTLSPDPTSPASGGDPLPAVWKVTQLNRDFADGTFHLVAIANRPALVIRKNGLPGWRYIAALNLNGSQWPEETQQIAAFGPTGTFGHFLDCQVFELNGLPAAYLPCAADDASGGHYFTSAAAVDGTQWSVPQQIDGYHAWGAGRMLQVAEKPFLLFWENEHLNQVAAVDSRGQTWEALRVLPGDLSVSGSSLVSCLALGDVLLALHFEDQLSDQLSAWRGAGAPVISWSPPQPLPMQLRPGGMRDMYHLQPFLVGSSGRAPLLRGSGGEGLGTSRDLVCQRAQDANATSWFPAQLIPLPDSSADETGPRASIGLVGDRPCVAYRDASSKSLHFIEAEDETGSAWGDPVSIDDRDDCGYYLELIEIDGQPAIAYSVDEGPAYRTTYSAQRTSAVVGPILPEAYVTALRFARRAPQ